MAYDVFRSDLPLVDHADGLIWFHVGGLASGLGLAVTTGAQLGCFAACELLLLLWFWFNLVRAGAACY